MLFSPGVESMCLVRIVKKRAILDCAQSRDTFTGLDERLFSRCRDHRLTVPITSSLAAATSWRNKEGTVTAILNVNDIRLRLEHELSQPRNPDYASKQAAAPEAVTPK